MFFRKEREGIQSRRILALGPVRFQNQSKWCRSNPERGDRKNLKNDWEVLARKATKMPKSPKGQQKVRFWKFQKSDQTSKYPNQSIKYDVFCLFFIEFIAHLLVCVQLAPMALAVLLCNMQCSLDRVLLTPVALLNTKRRLLACVPLMPAVLTAILWKYTMLARLWPPQIQKDAC